MYSKQTIIKKIRQELKAIADPQTKVTGKTFFKEEIKLYGVSSSTVQKLAAKYFKEIKTRSKVEVFELCELLWRSGYLEETGIACTWSEAVHKQYAPPDFQIFTHWIRSYVSNWAACDTLCNHTVGSFLEMYPQFIAELKNWAISDDRWMKRAAAVSLIIPARRGKFLKDIFEIADTLLLDPDDMVQKGYGWMLKAASQVHQKSVFDYVMQRKSIMPRTALRYAIEKMPLKLKKKAMQK